MMHGSMSKCKKVLVKKYAGFRLVLMHDDTLYNLRVETDCLIAKNCNNGIIREMFSKADRMAVKVGKMYMHTKRFFRMYL